MIPVLFVLDNCFQFVVECGHHILVSMNLLLSGTAWPQLGDWSDPRLERKDVIIINIILFLLLILLLLLLRAKRVSSDIYSVSVSVYSFIIYIYIYI